MKKCPRCGHSSKDSNQYCPNCGYQFKKSTKFDKQNNLRNKIIEVLLACFVVVGFFQLSFSSINQSVEESEIELFESTSYENLEQYSALNDESVSITTSISKLESEMEKIYEGYEITKAYDISVLEDTVVNCRYSFSLDDESTYVTIKYDTSDNSNIVSIDSYHHNISDFNEAYNSLVDNKVEELYVLLSKEPNLELASQINEFKELEDKFNEQEHDIGNYGLSIIKESSNDDCTISILNQDEIYYKTRINYNLEYTGNHIISTT